MKKTTRWMLIFTAAALLLMAMNFTPSVASKGRSKGNGLLSNAVRQKVQVGDQALVQESKSQEKRRASDNKSTTTLVKEDKADTGNPSETDGDDPDLPPFMQGKIDKEAYLQMRAENTGLLRGLPHNLSYDPRSRAIRQMENQEAQIAAQMRKSGISQFINGAMWTPLGPAPIPNGSTSEISVPTSGRTISIAVHPTNPDIVYVGTAQGGLYKSTTGGANWIMLFDFDLESLAIGAITIDPTDPNIVYVGTGEPNFSADSFAGKGLYIIRNADGTPVLTGPFRLSASGSDVFSGRAISKILVDPSDNNVIYVSTTSGTAANPSVTPGTSLPNRGIYRSLNAQSVSPTFAQIPITAVSNYNRDVVDMVLEPDNSNVLICTVVGVAPDNDGGIYRTTNLRSNSPTFTRTLPLPSGATNGRAELAINKVGTVVTVLAATGELAPPGTCPTGNAGQVRKSIDGGLSWSAALPGSQGFCGGQCFYDIAIALHPNNNTMLLGGAARGTCSDVMKRSVDGTTFVRDDRSLHADTHVNVFAPSNPSIAYTGNDGGIWRSNDAGDNWTSLNNMDFSATQFQDLAVHPFDRFFTIGGTQDNGTNCLRPDGTWINCRGGDGGYTIIDQNATGTTNVRMYHTFFNQTNNQIGFERSENSGTSWTFRGCSGTTSNNGIRCADNVMFYAPMAQGPGDPNTIYFGTDRLYRSADRGDTMKLFSQGPLIPLAPPNPLMQGVAITTIGISPQNDDVRIVGMRNGQVFATTTGSSTLRDVTGSNFPPPNPLDPARNSIGRAVIDPNNPNTAYVTFLRFGLPDGQHVFKTTNLDNPTPTWMPAGNGIPDVPVNAFAVDPQNSNHLYAGTDIGVYRSEDGGANWVPFSNGLPRVAVFDLEIANAQRILRIATHGRGIYEITLPGRQLAVIRLANKVQEKVRARPGQ